MSQFSYTAERNDGEVYRGTAEAADRFELYRIIRREGGKILSIEEDRTSNIWSLSYWSAILSTVKEQDKILFARNLGAMLGAGLALARALAVLERQTTNPKLAATIAGIASDVRRGDALDIALGKFPRVFSPLFTAMVHAGEEGGDLSGTLRTIADQMERVHTLKKKVRSALIYPAIVVIAIVGIGILMMTQVVPTLANTFEEMNAELPASTQAIIALSDFLVQHTIAAIVIFCILVASIYASLKSAAGRRLFEKTLLLTPIIGVIVREVNSARTGRTLSSLLSAGVDVLQAIEITGEVVQNSHFRDVLKEAGKHVSAGEPFSQAFAQNEKFYPPFVGEMVAVGEETGQLGEMLKRLAEYYEDEVDRKTKDLSAIIEPFLMVAIGGAVGFFAISMISPIYSLSQNI